MEGGSLNLETLKSSLLFNFRTGNVAVDTIITGLIICLSTYIINIASKLQNIDYYHIFEKWFGKKPEPEPLKNIINVSGREEDGCRTDAFLALIHRIKKLNCATSEISQMSEIRIDSNDNKYYVSCDDEEMEELKDKKYNNGANLMVSQPDPFIIAENVQGVVNNHSKNSDDDATGGKKEKVSTPQEENLSITISSTVHTMDELRGMLDQWIKDYRDSIKPDDYLRYFLYREIAILDRTAKYEEFKYESGKSFDNIFFPQKDDIIKRIDFFTENKEWYRKRGVPHTLGFMFYGKPGCGKTSTIKAIANYTKRHIVSVPLSKINSCKELLSIFYNNRLNDKHIPLNKRLYVLEDIDADDFKHIVADRQKKTSDDVSSDEGFDSTNEQESKKLLLKQLLKCKKGEEGVKTNLIDMMSSNLTLAGILEVLDGVMEMDGRMLVMTTNYPERLDEALVRPGRIDMKVNFGKCTTECLIQIYQHFFGDSQCLDLWPVGFDKSTLPTDRWSPAEAVQILLGNINHPHQALGYLINDFPSSGYETEDASKPTKDLKEEAETTSSDIQYH